MEGAELIELPEGGPRDWRLQLITAFGKLAAQEKTQALPQPSLPDLPIVEVQAHGNTSKLFAVMLSGDGGWAGLDREVAAALTARGVSVVGIDSLRYFWQARTPQGLADDLDRVLRYYAGRWQKSRALLIGYLQGADVLPFALNRLPAASRALVAQTALLGIGNQAAFEFHLSNWVGKSGDHPILPEVRRWPANTALCIYGAEEKDSPCPVAFASHTLPIRLTGGHHFNGDYDVLARTILEHVPE
ncbi:MAG: hypothetical protein CGU29_14070 [Candidatus Dactylopiibacterium carminicum]|uniref:Bacterial virulence domain-containing protein n=1 Tax=Candidatus Dactylopiibacterium carminicum TaxID=857335 RepID=A0A272EP32_9RHOO|nr:hypothetical protein BGI27_14450 [Candidatus Dactylopiibacterium carminicum]PAS91863.1 MAG: hypothetical protein CGU29_14070 [Candidatus Dactylopiibacterium carminicum]PAS97006.1 MAG: hypothetical protein BSR46_14485 [Candidatus Dactylopiibacterium carminicum]